MKSSSTAKRNDVWLIVLSALDVITGVLSLVFTALAIQVIAVMASGLTLMRAVKVAIQSEKTAIFVKPVAIYAMRKLTRSEKMKEIFAKIKENIKNNKFTLLTAFIELIVCGALGYESLDFFGRFDWAGGWKTYAVAFGAALVVYAILFVLTVYLGYDNPVFAAIRKFVKAIGGEKAVDALDKANEDVIAAVKAEEERKAAEHAAEIAKAEEEAAKALEEQKIYEYALRREEEKKAAAEEARRRQLINAYKGEFASVDAGKKDDVVEVVNNVNSHNI